jgi:HSP20 family protein
MSALGSRVLRRGRKFFSQLRRDCKVFAGLLHCPRPRPEHSPDAPIACMARNLLNACSLPRRIAAGEEINIMSIVRWDPFRELEDMSNRLNRVFGRFPLTREMDKDTMVAFDWAPSVDISESSEEFVIKAEIPGVNKDDVKVSIDDGVVSIQGERKQEKEEKDKKFHRVERSYGSFLRTFSLPSNIDDAKVQAQFKDGLLTVRLPKSASAKPKTVEVKVS